MALHDVVIEPMTDAFVLWRCLHQGPLSGESINQLPDDGVAWTDFRDRNVPLLKKLIEVYGSCAMVARDGEQVVGFVRFYPKVIFQMAPGEPSAVLPAPLCLQVGSDRGGPSRQLVDLRFPLLAEIEDKTLEVFCMMTGSPFAAENPYQRQGIGTRLVRELIGWAKTNGWTAIEATAYEDLDRNYEHLGSAGKIFWDKLGFHLVDTGT